jgi:hypothetical protein
MLPSAVKCCTGSETLGVVYAAGGATSGHCQGAAQFTAPVLAMPLSLLSEMRLEESRFTITAYPSSGVHFYSPFPAGSQVNRRCDEIVCGAGTFGGPQKIGLTIIKH